MRVHQLLACALAAALGAAAAQERVDAPAARAAPSARTGVSEPMRAGTAEMGAPPATTAEPAATAPMRAIPIGMGGGSFGGVSSTLSPTLEGAVGSGNLIPGTRTMRKTCPPGLQNRDGNCVPPIDGIMQP